MARRRPRWFAPVILIVLLAAVGFAAWRYGPAWLASREDARPVVTGPGPLNVCALVPGARAAEILGVQSVDARHVGAAADVPAAGSCTWDFGSRNSVVAMAFTRDSLARGSSDVFGDAYFESVVTGLEYALKAVPERIAGLGEEAAVAGFGRTATEEPAQLVARKGDTVVHLAFKGVDRVVAERFARALIEQL